MMPQTNSEVALKDSMQRYGKQAFNEKEQIKILYFILEDAKSKLSPIKLINHSVNHSLIEECQKELKQKENLQEAIAIVNQFIVDLEASDNDGKTVDYLKKRGLYRILYRNSRVKGELLPSNDILNILLRGGFVGVAISALIIMLFAATTFFAVPLWLAAITTGLFVGASTYLSGLLYGVVNDIFATNANLPYFLLGHQPQQVSLLRTNDKAAQGIAWGVAATFGPVIIATAVFAIAATITAFFVPMATFLLPVMVVAMPLIAIAAEFYARKKASEYAKQGECFDILLYTNAYQSNGLSHMCPTKEERAAWLATSDRNVFGFTKVPFIGLGSLVGLITLSAVSQYLPAVLFISPMIAVVIPAVLAAAACVSLIAAGIYMYVNRNKQVDDRYRLEFEREKLEPNLYLDEDMAYVRELEDIYGKEAATVVESSALANTPSANAGFFDRKPAPRTPVVLEEIRGSEMELDEGHLSHPGRGTVG